MIFDRIVKRQWGWYWTILDRKHFKVKLLRFWKGRKCSLQYHQYRNELWLMLKGFGSMKLDGRMEDMTAGEYCLVPVGTQHKFVAIKPSLILEIQYGDFCMESDIVRL